MNIDDRVTEILTKGVREVLPSKEFVKSLLLSGKRLTIYAGFDPTAPTLHIGHAIQLRKLRQFQDLGHRIIFLIGDFTARIGDPTDKGTARSQLSEKEIKQNLKLYKKQASQFIRFSGKNKAEVKFNNKWLGKMKFADVMNLASHMTVDQMLKRDMFARRMQEEKPIYIHEFFYPLMQGYDSVVMDVDGEIGGNDQLFNMLAGRALLKTLKNKEKFVITMKLLEDGNGRKMSKTEGNMVSLMDTPKDMYGKIMSWPDSLITSGFELCTDKTIEEVKHIEQDLAIGGKERDIKMMLALEIVKSCFGAEKALSAQQMFIETFQQKNNVSDVEEIISHKRTFEEIVIGENIIESKTQLRRLLEGNAISHFETKEIVTLEESKQSAAPGVYRIGKNRFIKII